MTVQKLDTTDGFVVYDYPDAPASGLVRRGKKILQRSATDLARSATYAFAFHEIKRGGASAGLNAEGEAAAPALDALLAEMADPLTSGQLELFAGKGLAPDELARPDSTSSASSPADSLSNGVLAAAEWALGSSLDGATFAIEGFSPQLPDLVALSHAASQRGATVVSADAGAKPWEIWASDVDVLLTGSKPGAMNHQGAETVKATAVIPWGPIPITTKALAILLRREITYVPDFVSASGALLGHHLNAAIGNQTGDLAAQVATRLDAVAQTSDEPLFVACCIAAERFLDTWQDSRPFGRPLAG